MLKNNKIIINTPRLALREIVEDDAQGIFDLDSDPQVHRYLGNKTISHIAEAEDVIKFIQKQYKELGIGRWAVIHKDTGAFVGWAGLKYVTEEYNGYTNYYDLGYRLLRKFWGQGYATEAAEACLHYGYKEMKLEKIYAAADVNNNASNHILQKIGLSRRNQFLWGRQWCYWYEGTRQS